MRNDVPPFIRQRHINNVLRRFPSYRLSHCFFLLWAIVVLTTGIYSVTVCRVFNWDVFTDHGVTLHELFKVICNQCPQSLYCFGMLTVFLEFI